MKREPIPYGIPSLPDERPPPGDITLEPIETVMITEPVLETVVVPTLESPYYTLDGYFETCDIVADQYLVSGFNLDGVDRKGGLTCGTTEDVRKRFDRWWKSSKDEGLRLDVQMGSLFLASQQLLEMQHYMIDLIVDAYASANGMGADIPLRGRWGSEPQLAEAVQGKSLADLDDPEVYVAASMSGCPRGIVEWRPDFEVAYWERLRPTLRPPDVDRWIERELVLKPSGTGPQYGPALRYALPNHWNIDLEDYPSTPYKRPRRETKQARKTILRGMGMLSGLCGPGFVRDFLAGKEVSVQGVRYTYVIQKSSWVSVVDSSLRPPMASPYALYVKGPSGDLCSACIYFKDTPIIDQIIAMFLHVNDPDMEVEFLKSANLAPLEYTDAYFKDEFLMALHPKKPYDLECRTNPVVAQRVRAARSIRALVADPLKEFFLSSIKIPRPVLDFMSIPTPTVPAAVARVNDLRRICAEHMS